MIIILIIVVIIITTNIDNGRQNTYHFKIN